jgi:uroporphyrinogen decarboxylase
MTPSTSLYRERFACTLAHQVPDRVPMDLDATDMTGIDGGPRRLAPLLGINPSAFASDADTDEAVLRALDIDIRGVGGILPTDSKLARRVSATELIDMWGIGYRFNGHHFEAVDRPLQDATLADLDKYPWPDPDRLDPAVLTGIAERARFLYERTPYVVCARHPCFGVLELGCWMCGFEDFLYRLAAEPEFVRRFFDIIHAYQTRIQARYYAAVGPYIHFTTSGDDFGTQTGPFLSPAMFADLVAPSLTARIRQIRGFTDAAFFHHTCGSVFALIPHLLAAGVEILNPIQPRATDMEPDRLKSAFGDRLTFYGGVDTQWLLPQGTVAEVEETTRALIRTLGKSGGFILSAAHTLQEDIPQENILALYRAGRGE